MSLQKQIEEKLDLTKVEDQDRREAIRRAEELSDEFSDIKPKTDMPSPEQFMGIPVSSKSKSLF
ncbi:MAG: hypothetical protein OXI05_05280 [Bacteroidota bacterium]|nr:hypothetical protein [Bacteroidota bacterium]MDE2645233.1 hypothetical protein [Bacteroidota bacterium]MXW32512.1 hypothetical protein [Rhodothermaceae bacterium]MYE62709.1 hypothetical protein [Rhodothermaceae bacterium]MYJ21176.1 hypothetical protein [Rhodothermaceae bacterium]